MAQPTANDLICNCLQVTRKTILEAIAKGARTVDDISEATQASTGCGGCRPDIEEILAEELKKKG